MRQPVVADYTESSRIVAFSANIETLISSADRVIVSANGARDISIIVREAATGISYTIENGSESQLLDGSLGIYVTKDTRTFELQLKVREFTLQGFKEGSNPSKVLNTKDTLAQETSLGKIGQGQATRYTIVIAGQSNGEGNGVMPSPIPLSLAGCQMIGKDNVYRNLIEPSHNRYSGAIDNWTPVSGNPANARYSMATDLANWLKRLTGSDVLILPCAVGSTFIPTWLTDAYTDPPVLTSLFGQMRDRVNKACQGDFSRLIIIHHGHEGEVGGTAISRATNYVSLITAYRYWFGNVPIIIPQLASHTDGPTALLSATGADTQRQLDQDYGDSSIIASAFITSSRKNTNNGLAAASPDWYFSGNTATSLFSDIAGGVRMTTLGGDGNGLALAFNTFAGHAYKIAFRANCSVGAIKIALNGINPASGWTLDGVAQAVQSSNLTGNHLYEFTWVSPTDSSFALQRNAGGTTTVCDFTLMSIQEAATAKTPNVFVYPTWDVAMNGSLDAYHLATAGQKVNGKRAAYCIAKRILSLPDLRTVDASGAFVAHVGHPFVTSARNVSGSTTVVSVFFNQVITNKGADNLWLVEVGSVAQTISSVAINADTTRIDITLSAPITAGSATVSYAAVQENTDGSAFTNFVRNAEGLPPVRFYRYLVAAT